MIRTLLIKILFRLLRVDNHFKEIVLLEDLKILEGTVPVGHLLPQMTERHTTALATAFICPNYREYLYYVLVKMQREHIRTIDASKRASQQAGSLFILHHLQEMKMAYNNLQRRGQLPERKLKEILRSFHKQPS